jgi:hypothetical protein
MCLRCVYLVVGEIIVFVNFILMVVFEIVSLDSYLYITALGPSTLIAI